MTKKKKMNNELHDMTRNRNGLHLEASTVFRCGDAAYVAQTTSDGSLTVAVDTRQDDALRMAAVARDLCNRVNKLRKKAKLAITDLVDIYYDDGPAEKGAIPTSAALEASAAVVAKAKMCPIPASRMGFAAPIAEDVAPTPFGSSHLTISLCKPTPSLSAKAKADFKGNTASLESLVAALSPSTLFQRPVAGSLDGVPFELKVGTDIYASGTAAYKASL